MLELAKGFRRWEGSTITCGVLYNSVNARSLKLRVSRRKWLFLFCSVSLDLRAGYIVRLISVLNFSYLHNSYLRCIGSLKTVFRKQFARQRFISCVFDNKPVSQTIPRIFHTRPLTPKPLVTWVLRVSFKWYRQAVSVCSFKAKNKEKERKSNSRMTWHCSLLTLATREKKVDNSPLRPSE